MNRILATIAAVIMATSTASIESEVTQYETAFSSQKIEQAAPKTGQAAQQPVIEDTGDYYTITITVTEYCSCSKCGGGVDRKGNPLKLGTVAFNTKYGFKYGQKVEWNGNTYYVRDTGCKYGVMDVFVGSNHADCDSKWSNQAVKIYK